VRAAEPRDDAKPAPELQALDYFVGSWSCKGRLEPSAQGPGRVIRGALFCRWELGRFFLGVAEDDEQSLAHPQRRQARAFWGYDPAAKLYTCGAFFFGGARMIGTSAGWRGKKLTFTCDLHDGPTPVTVHQSMTRESDDDMIIRVEVVGADGEVSTRMEETCHRQGEG
jgi:hypothetical protein